MPLQFFDASLVGPFSKRELDEMKDMVRADFPSFEFDPSYVHVVEEFNGGRPSTRYFRTRDGQLAPPIERFLHYTAGHDLKDHQLGFLNANVFWSALENRLGASAVCRAGKQRCSVLRLRFGRGAGRPLEQRAVRRGRAIVRACSGFVRRLLRSTLVSDHRVTAMRRVRRPWSDAEAPARPATVDQKRTFAEELLFSEPDIYEHDHEQYWPHAVWGEPSKATGGPTEIGVCLFALRGHFDSFTLGVLLHRRGPRLDYFGDMVGD